APALPWLSSRDCLESVVVDGFHKAVSQHIERHAEGADVFAAGSAFLRLGADRPIIEERTIRNHRLTSIDQDVRVNKVTAAVLMSETKLGNLTCAASDRILMTFRTGTSVVKWP